MTDGFTMLLVATSILRGLGAGFILAAQLMTLPMRRRMDFAAYGQFIRGLYKGWGVKAYAAITALGLLGLVALAVLTFLRGDQIGFALAIYGSLAATILGLSGTAGAYPAMRRLWDGRDSDETTVAMLLDRFAAWGNWSAASHLAAFGLVNTALVIAPP